MFWIGERLGENSQQMIRVIDKIPLYPFYAWELRSVIQNKQGVAEQVVEYFLQSGGLTPELVLQGEIMKSVLLGEGKKIKCSLRPNSSSSQQISTMSPN